MRRFAWLALAAVVVVTALYAAAGFLGGPWLVDRWLDAYRDGSTDRSASRGDVSFNPFTLVGEVTSLELGDAATGTAFLAQRITVDFAVRTLIERRPVLHAVSIDSPRLTVEALTDLAAIARRARRLDFYPLRIEALSAAAGTVFVGQEAAGAPALRDLGVSLTGFDGESAEPADFSIAGRTAAGADVAIAGTLAGTLTEAEGELSFGAVALGPIADRLGGTLAAVAPVGEIGLTAQFRLTGLTANPAVELTAARIESAGIALAPGPGLAATTGPVSARGDLSFAAAAEGPGLSGRLTIDGVAIALRDARIVPAQSFAFADAAVLVTANRDNDELSLSLAGPLDAAGDGVITIRRPLVSTGAVRVAFEVGSLEAGRLSPYLAASLGRRLTAGEADLEVDYTSDGTRVDGSMTLVARGLELAPVESGGASAASLAGRTQTLDLAAALLEDTDGIIRLDLPFVGNSGLARDAAAAALSARLAAITSTPFDALGSAAAGDAAVAGAIPFLPGDPALTEVALGQIARLADALAARPRLGVRVLGAYDRRADREALARQQIELHVQLATAGPLQRGRPAPIDVDSPRARDVLDEFAGERLPPARVTELRERFACEGALAAVCEHTYYESIFDALIANEDISTADLNRLARFRALSVADALRQHGVGDARIEVVSGAQGAAVSDGGGVAVELVAAGDAVAGDAGIR